MEHLLFSGAPAPILFQYIPEEQWDGGDFMSYPQRKGWDKSIWEWSEKESPLSERLNAAAKTYDDLAAFLQSWLFFGLLETVFNKTISHSDFVRSDQVEDCRERSLITTSKLNGYLDDLSNSTAKLSSEEQLQREDVIYDALAEAVLINRAIDRWIERGDVNTGPELHLLKNTVLCQTLLDCAIRRAFSEMFGREPSWMDGPCGNTALEQSMRAAGWCPFTVHYLLMHLKPDDMAFVFSLGTVRTEQDHSPCLERLEKERDHCIAAQQVSYDLPFHVTPDCECPLLSPPMDRVMSYIENGDVPLIAISIPDDPSQEIELHVSGIEFEEERSMLPYLAMSHVWTDGLGNPSTNGLPQCQIRRIGESLLELEGTQVGDPCVNENHVRPDRRVTADFWMDTFCIPVNPNHLTLRHRCIDQMRKIYHNAAAVVVLDPDLQQLSRDAKPVEILARVLSCSWRSRLWTFQEGSLAWDLCVPIKEGIFFLGEIDKQASGDVDSEDGENRPISRGDILEASMSQSIAAAYSKIVRGDLASMYLPDDPSTALKNMLRAIAYRNTAREGDETICLATFMGSDPSPLIAQVHPHDRMVKFLQSLPVITKAILFSHGPRLDIAGFRWAPQTFLSPHGFQTNVRFPLTYRPHLPESAQNDKVPVPQSYLHPESLGLVSFFAGVKFNHASKTALPEHFLVTTSQDRTFVIDGSERGQNRPWNEVCGNPDTEWAIIFANDGTLNSINLGLLVEWVGLTSEGYIQCKWKYELEVENLDEAILEGARDEQLHQHNFQGEALPFQWWVID